MAYPQFEAPEWMTGRISALRQKFAAPQVGRLKRQMGGWMGMGYDPQAIQARRATIRGFGEGLGGIMSGAGQLALSQYGQEYGTQFEAARLTHGAGMEEERGRLAREEAERGREFESEEARRRREHEESQLEYERTGERPRRRTATMFPGLAKGGPVTKKPYLVGEEGPELFVPNTSGRIIPNPQTQKKMKSKSLYIPRQYGGWVSGPEQEKLRRQVESKKYRDILRGGRTTKQAVSPTSPISAGIMNYLMSKQMGPGAGWAMGKPTWQMLLHKRPQMLAGLLSFLQGRKFDFGSPGGAPIPREWKARPTKEKAKEKK